MRIISALAIVESADEFLDRQKKIVSPDMTNLVTTKLSDGWLATFQYNKDKYYAVVAYRKIGKRWIRCDARPHSAEAVKVTADAFKSLRAAKPAK